MTLKVCCLVKQTLPTEAKISLLPNGSVGDPKSKPIMNPYDEFAVEEAVQWRESGRAAEVVILTLGTPACEETIRKALAMGADSAILIDCGSTQPDGAQTAAAIAEVLRPRGFDLILAGRLSVDRGAGEVAARVAALLDIPLVGTVSKIELDGKKVVATREADGNKVVVECQTPVMLTADKSLNKPRYPNLPNIMKAKKKPLEVVPLSGLAAGSAHSRPSAYELPGEKGPVRMVGGAPDAAAVELVRLLTTEAGVIN